MTSYLPGTPFVLTMNHPKGFKEPGEEKINELLREAARLILDKAKYGYEDIDEWKKGWQEAFDHHLNGCK